MQRIFTIIAALALFLVSVPAQAQLLNKFCGHNTILKEAKEHEPMYFQSYFNLFEEYKSQKASLRGTDSDDTTYTIQVVVHVVYQNDNVYENMPDSIIISQIEALNRDFNLLNPDSSKTRDIFKPIIGNPKIKFQLATTRPNGTPTNGIIRKKATPDLLGRGFGALPLFQRNVKRNAEGGVNAWNTSKYLNIWVCDLNNPPIVPGGFLGGYATPPGGLDNWPALLTATIGGPNDQGVVIDYRFFGVNNLVSQDSAWLGVYNYGRTTTHEVGHYLGLRHIWGDAQVLSILGLSPCSEEADDGIDDTPYASDSYTASINSCIENGGSFSLSNCICSTGETNSCDEGSGDMPDLFENYMDYSSDYCYTMFTQGQSDFMRWVLTNKRPDIIVARTIETPTGITVIRSNENRIDIFPNPSSGKLFVDQQLFNKGTIGIEVIDMLGKTVYTTSVNAAERQFTLDLPKLASAMYFVNFKNEEISTTERILIKR